MAMSQVTETEPNDTSLLAARTILLIEDDPDIAAAIEAELRSEGYRVEQAGTFEEGMEAVRASHPSAILLDRGLNGEDGLRILESMRGEGDHTPALVISAMSTVDDRILGLKAGGDDYLTKPFDLRELSARLEALLRRRGDDRVTRLRCRDIEMDLVER